MRRAETDPDRKPVAAEDSQGDADLIRPEVRLRGRICIRVERDDQEAPDEREQSDQRQAHPVFPEDACEQRFHSASR